MKKTILMFAILLIGTFAIFCQTTGNDVGGALTNLGLSPMVITIITSVLVVIGQLIPEKWASPLLWIEKVLWALFTVFNRLNNQTNNLSKSQKSRGVKGGTLMVILLLLCGGISQAQSFDGFFKPAKANKQLQKLSIQSKDATAPSTLWVFRPYYALTAAAIPLNKKPFQVQSFNSGGIGLSYSKFTDLNGLPYCTLAVNGLLLIGAQLGETTSTSMGGGVTLGLFNNQVGFGAAYLDKSVLFLTTVTIRF